MSVSVHELVPALERLGRPRIAVVGDYMLDRYVWGDATRVSPEAPVPVVHAAREEDRPGGAGNVVANLVALGAEVACFGFVGEDAGGTELRAMLAGQGATVDGLLACSDRPTIQKIRVMARNQQMLRVDREESAAPEAARRDELLAALGAAAFDAVVLSDYGKGCLGEEVTARTIELARQRGVPTLVDPKHRDLGRYRGATLVTPNRAEAEAAAGEALPDLGTLATVGERLRREAGLERLLVTLGPDGMFLLAGEDEAFHLPTAARQVYDVTGAGDTVIAMLAMALAEGVEDELAVKLANAAAGVAVAKVGTTAVGRE
ncbi:MAG: D-glycero-beta-D-manno-heptose-7-phosphate kinase, partial [Planctomycetota bacterium]